MRRAAILAAWLACTALNLALLARTPPPVDTDEIYWLGQTYYYHLAFRARDWRHPDWMLIPARENPPVAKYVLGAGVTMQGFPIASLDLLGSFYAYFDVNLGRHPGFPARLAAQDSVQERMMPGLRRAVSESKQMFIGPELLRAGRRVALFCGVVTSFLVLLLGMSVSGAATGLVASQLFLLHPSVVGAYRYAMSDAPAFMLGTAAMLVTWLLVRRSGHSVREPGHSEREPGHSERSEESAPARGRPLASVAITVLAGTLIGLAVGAKLNWVVAAILFGVVWAFVAVRSWRAGAREAAGRAALLGVIGLATSLVVFVVVNPSIVFDPLHELLTPVRELGLAARMQAAVLPRPPFLATLGARLDAVASLLLWTPWAFVLAVALLAVACVKAPKPGVWFVAAWWAIAFVAVAAWIPFEWARYALPVTVPSVLLAAHALSALAFSVVRRRTA